MQHVTVKASVAEATDTGTFTAIAAAWSTDRTNERIIRGAFADTIRRWRSSGKDVPLAWDHGRSASEIIGSIDPNSMAERNSGLFVAGKLDIEDSELAREAWRSVKRNRISLSFGYKVDRSRKATDGVQELTSLDLYEITLTTVPANADTRVLSAKSMRPRRYLDRDNNLVSYDELLAGLKSLARGEKAARPVRVVEFDV